MRKGNLLIIDDEQLIVDNLADLLKPDCDRVDKAYGGKQGLLLIEENKYDCIVCDINMPDLNGVDVLRKVRSENLITCPFVFFTAHGNEDLMLEAAQLGAFDFLDKPHLDELEEVVKRALNKGMGINLKNTESDYESEFQKLLKK